MTRNAMLFLAFVLVALSATACVPPKALINNSVQTKYLLQQSAQNKQVFDFYVRICDAQDDKSVNCRDSLVLDNVVARSMY